MTSQDARIVVFESPIRENFYPLSLTRPTFDFLLGTKTLIDRIQDGIGKKVTDVTVPKYLENTTEENHPGLKVNEDISEKCVAINSLVSSTLDLKSLLDKYWKEAVDLVLIDPTTGQLVFAILGKLEGRELARIALNSRRSGTRQVPPPSTRALTRFPWQLVEENAHAISIDFRAKSTKSLKTVANGPEILGNKLQVAENCEIGRFVTLDSRKGPIIIEGDSEIQSLSHLSGPCFVGKGTVVKSARIREGTSIANDCRISGEVEETIVFDHTNKNHEGFIGHSVVGSWVNLGAMTSNSDLKNSYGKIKAKIGGRTVNTESIKVGVLIGDMTKTAIGTMIYSGKTIGVSSHVFGTVIDDVPSYTIHATSLGAKSAQMFLESATETQKRMMARRNLIITKNQVELMKAVFELTSKDRNAANVRAGKFDLGS